MQKSAISTTLSISYFVLGVFGWLCFIACGGTSSTKKELDTPTSGTATIAVDESFYPFMESEVYTFNGIYNEAHVIAKYLPEVDAFNEMLKDSARIVVAARTLNKEEEDYFKKINITPQITKIAYDALAVIVNKANPDSQITYNNLSAIMSGKSTSWKSLNKKSSLDKVQIVFDNSKSSTCRYIREKFNNNGPLPSNCFAAKSNKELVEYVAANKNAIGILGVNWISDRDDTTSLTFLNKISVAAIAPPDTMRGAGKYYQPYQAFIAQGVYPLKRTLYVISREARSGLGNGFSAFVAGDKGQRIILKSSLVPATVPVRVVGFRQ